MRKTGDTREENSTACPDGIRAPVPSFDNSRVGKVSAIRLSAAAVGAPLRSNAWFFVGGWRADETVDPLLRRLEFIEQAHRPLCSRHDAEQPRD